MPVEFTVALALLEREDPDTRILPGILFGALDGLRGRAVTHDKKFKLRDRLRLDSLDSKGHEYRRARDRQKNCEERRHHAVKLKPRKRERKPILGQRSRAISFADAHSVRENV